MGRFLEALFDGTDWPTAASSLTPAGSARVVEGGYRVSARKVFSSGCETATLMITSAQYDDPETGPRVLHFPVAYEAEGVRITATATVPDEKVRTRRLDSRFYRRRIDI